MERFNDQPTWARCAVPAGTYKGKRFYRFVVFVESGERASLGMDFNTDAVGSFEVKARNSTEALESIAKEFNTQPCITLRTAGPKGGVKERYWGWHTAIGNSLINDTNRWRT